MPFSNPVVGGTALVRAAIKSPNYVAGSQGWTINRDGSAEFSGVTMRGNLTLVGTAGRQLSLTVDSGGLPGIHYTDSTAASGKSGDIFAQAQLGTVVLILSSGSVLNLSSQLTQPTLQLGARVATLGILEPGTGAIHGGNLTLLEQRAALEYWDPAPVPAAKLNSVELNSTNVLVQKPMIVTGETWHTPVLTAPFIGAGSPVQYRLMPDGDVELRGGALYGSPPPVGGFAMFTLPVGYRPAIQDEYAIARQGVYGAGKIVVDTAGLVTYWVNDAAANPQLGGVRFSTIA